LRISLPSQQTVSFELLLFKIFYCYIQTESSEVLKPKLNSKWNSIRDKKVLEKIRIQRFNEDLPNSNTFLKKNELIFEKYHQNSKGTNFFNLFGSSTKKIGVKNALLPFTKNIIAQKFTSVLKKQLLAHALNEKQIKFLQDSSYSKMTEFAKRRQKIQKKFNGTKELPDQDSTVNL